MRSKSHSQVGSWAIFVLWFSALLLIIGALLISYVDQAVNLLSITFFLLGMLALLLCFFYNARRTQATLSRNKGVGREGVKIQWKRLGSLIMVVSLAITLLFGVNYLAEKSAYRWDLTGNQQHTLSPLTLDFVKGINKPVELTAFYVGLPPKYLEDLLNEYQRVSNKMISVDIVDPIEDIAYAAKFGNVISGKERKLIVVSGDERKDIDFSETSLSEEQVTNALARVSREARQACFLIGHGESSVANENSDGFSLFANLLATNNISSKSLMLGIEKRVPEDCHVLVIAGPRTDLTRQEQVLVQEYLEKGGDALFLIEAVEVVDQRASNNLGTPELNPKAPSLNAILNEWGVNVGHDVVVDLNSHVGDDVASPATRNYIDHKAITAGLDYTFYIRPRSITVLNDRRASIKLAAVALSASTQQSWAETNPAMEIKFDEGLDLPGPIAVSYIIWEKKQLNDESDTRIIVFTDADFLSNAYLNQYSNSEMGMNVISWLSELDYTVFLDKTKAEVERMDLTSKQKRMVAALLFVMPLLIAVIGFGVWTRRRP